MSAETFIRVGDELFPASEQPPQSELQGAFRADGQRIVIDMPAAREIARDRIRTAREPMFIANDAAWNKASMLSDTPGKNAAKARAQVLRAAPQDPRIDGAETPDALLSAVSEIIAEMGA